MVSRLQLSFVLFAALPLAGACGDGALDTAPTAEATLELDTPCPAEICDVPIATPHLGIRSRIARFIADKIGLAEINGRVFTKFPTLDDPEIGRSTGFPVGLAIDVGPASTGFPAGVGKTVHDELFPGRPFKFNVVFARAHSDILGHGDYSNPQSIWYNVFLGYYEIDVKKSVWGRPFGYDISADGTPTILINDIKRIGKADWNHFSNELYGVPKSAIAVHRLDDVSETSDPAPSPPRVKREGWDGAWDLVDLNHVKVVGPYSATGLAGYDRSHPLVGWMWRYAFGRWSGFDRTAKSFEPVHMRGKFFMTFKADRDKNGEPIYRTFLFGGTVNEAWDSIDPAKNKRFLDLQLDTVAKIIAKERGIGFAPMSTQ